MNASLLAWIALVPLVIAATRPVSPRSLAGWSALAGLFYWLISVYWLQPITTLGWIVLCLYSAPLWVLFALAIQWCHWRRWPLIPCVALLWVGAEQCQGLFLGGFYWRFLAHSQFQNQALIQIADVLGAAGVSFLIAWVNGFFAEGILAVLTKRLNWPRIRPHVLTVVALVAGTLAYGHYRLAQVPRVTRPGPSVGVVQSSIPQHVKEAFQASDEILTDLLVLSQACADTEVDLIVWPETMIQAILDETVWAHLASEEYVAQCRAKDDLLKAHARGTAFILAGTYGGSIDIEGPNQVRLVNYNSANLFRPDGTRDPARYDKIKPILFGESLPFKTRWPWMHRLILSLTPYDYDYTLAAGSEYTRFAMRAPVHDHDGTATREDYHFGVIICYEDTLPQISRSYALDAQGQKQIDWLVNISNDGWFVRFDPDTNEVTPSTELVQHLAACVFRAVENRVSIVRSVNTGISCLIDSTGAIRSGYHQASPGFPMPALARQGMAGWFTDRITLDTRTTFFSRWGRWLDHGCLTIFVTGGLVGLLRSGKTGRRIRFSRNTN
jgi:apolipoprotein N-acyltransferase